MHITQLRYLEVLLRFGREVVCRKRVENNGERVLSTCHEDLVRQDRQDRVAYYCLLLADLAGDVHEGKEEVMRGGEREGELDFDFVIARKISINTSLGSMKYEVAYNSGDLLWY